MPVNPQQDTLRLVMGAMVVPYAVMVLNMWRQHRHLPGVCRWVLAAVVGGVGLVLTPAVQWFDEHWGAWVLSLSHMAGMTMIVLMLDGALRFRGIASRGWGRWGLWLLLPVAIMVLSNNAYPIRRYLMHDAVSVGLLLVTMAVLLWRPRPEDRRQLAQMAFFLLVLSIGLMVRWGIALGASATWDVYAHPAIAAVYLCITIFVIGWTYSVNNCCEQVQRRKEKRFARLDPLTGLPNQRYFDEVLTREVARAQRSGESFALAVVDVVGMEGVNLRYGHDAGDALLVEVAQRLRRFARTGDLLARIGPDEFGVIVYGVANADQIESTLTRLGSALNGPAMVLNGAMVIETTLGMATWPDDARTPQGLLALAQQRLDSDLDQYQASRSFMSTMAGQL